jgi:Mg-chelatase subunit ChlD
MNRTMLAASLLAGAGLWVALLAATSGGPMVATIASPTAGGVNADRAAVKFVDKANFYAADSTGDHSGEITLRLDVLDKAGNPIADLKKEDVQVQESDLPGRVKSFRGPASQAANVILVIDVSGSMAQQGRIAGARRAAHAALDSLKVDRDRIGIIAFHDDHEFRAPFEIISLEHRQNCERQIDRLRPLRGTRIGPAVVAALRKFGEAKPDGLKMVLLMTDGDDNERDRFARLREQIGDLSDQLGVQVHSISVGDEVSQDGEEDLRDLAAKGKGRYERAPSAERLADLFRSRVTETVNECTLVYDSPYPKADGFDRPITVTIRTPAGPLTATASYKIGPLLSGRSEPAAWALAAPVSATPGAAPAARIGGGIRGPLFACLLAGLLAALALPALRRKAPATEPPPALSIPTTPQSIRPPPPPPRVAGAPPQSVPRPASPMPASVAPRPTTGSVL